MALEIEAKFLNIQPDALRERLRAEGFDCQQPDQLMRRVVFEHPAWGTDAWARVRDEGNSITVSYKRTHDANRVDGTEEIQVTVNDFEEARRLLRAFGLEQKSYQETRREIWTRDTVEVTIDHWPALAPFAEIEAPDEEAIRQAAADLGFDWAQAMFGSVGSVYETIGIEAIKINRFHRVTFENVEEILGLREAG